MRAERNPLRVMVVDDSRLMRRLIRGALEGEPDLRVVAEAGDGRSALRMIDEVSADVVTLDVEMPGMSGLELLERLMRERPTAVVMVSAHTTEGADATLAALQAGAVDVAPKPSGAEGVDGFGRRLREKVRLAARAQVRRRTGSARPLRSVALAQLRSHGSLTGAGRNPPRCRTRGDAAARKSLLAVGASTGGVAAIGELLDGLPADASPVVVAQHMPEGYTERFARRLRDRLRRDVAEARDGEALSEGMVRIAPGALHLEVAFAGGRLLTHVVGGEPVSGHRPSVDVLFGSVARAAGRDAVGVILTGMGRDGAAGLRAMRSAGALCLGQSERSCVVYGMPRAARDLGAVTEELDLELIAPRVVGALRGALPERPRVDHAPARNP